MTIVSKKRRVMRTPVVVVTGRGDTDGVAGVLMHAAGTVAVGHDFDGQVVRRWVSNLQHGVLTSAELPLELVNVCVSCTTRNDLLVLLRRLHRREDVTRIVVHLAPWLEPEPICWAIHRVSVSPGPGFVDGPAVRDVEIAAVVTTIDSHQWLGEALGGDELTDGRTVVRSGGGRAGRIRRRPGAERPRPHHAGGPAPPGPDYLVIESTGISGPMPVAATVGWVTSLGSTPW
jgi:G3E family GTPase